MAKPLRAFLLAAICVSTPCSGRAAELRFEPSSAHLGSFSTLNPLESAVSPAKISVRIQADRPWRLEVRLREPLRRIDDRLALPTTRVRNSPAISAPTFTLEPRVIMSGPGTRGSAEVLEWRDLAKAVEAYLELADPPGTYQGTLVGRLLDSSGAPLTGPVSMSIQFDVARWVEIVDDDVPEFSVAVGDETIDSESPMAAVRLISNTSWTLFISGDPARPPHKAVALAPGTLTACAPIDGPGGWRPLKSGCAPLGVEPVALVTGEAPPPFSVSNQEIPIVVRYRTARSVPAGAYGAAVRFTAKIGVPP